MLGPWFNEHPDCTDRDILFLFLLTNVLIAGLFGEKLNAVSVNVNSPTPHHHRILSTWGFKRAGALAQPDQNITLN